MAYDRRGGRGSRGGFGRPRFGGGGRGGYDMPKPIKVGEEYDVTIDEVGSKGDGIARIKNFVVFVAGAKKGEKIKIKITEVMSRFAIAEKVGAASEAAEAPEAEATEAPAEETEAEAEAEEATVEEPEAETEVEEEAAEEEATEEAQESVESEPEA
jgi:predicted RNA-binding protein with TRAM domain